MDLTQLANLGEFIGGVAVLVTLVYLALQVRQSTSAQRTAAELAVADLTYKTVSAYSLFYEMLADEGLAEIWAKAQRDEEISATEDVRLRAVVSELTYASVAAAFPRRIDRRTNVRKSFSHRTYRRLIQDLNWLVGSVVGDGRCCG